MMPRMEWMEHWSGDKMKSMKNENYRNFEHLERGRAMLSERNQPNREPQNVLENIEQPWVGLIDKVVTKKLPLRHWLLYRTTSYKIMKRI